MIIRILICIDDTDSLDSIGTGKLAAQLISTIEARGWGRCEAISRHQLFFHPDVPYTSHNSTMCFPAEIDAQYLPDLKKHCAKFLEQKSAPGSDPGLCIAITDKISNRNKLIAYSRRAKTMVLQKNEAYALANELGIHLSEHGGTGQGVIGALAGIGLRLTGNDGRFRGRHQITADQNIATVASIYRQANIDVVQTTDGRILNEHEKIIIGEKVKSILKDHKSVLLVQPVSHKTVRWQTCPKEFLKQY